MAKREKSIILKYLTKLKFQLIIGIIHVIIIPSTIIYGQNNFWEQTNGPYTEFINSLYVASNNHIFCGSRGGLIYRSESNGDSWTLANQDLEILDVTALVGNSVGNIFVGDDFGRIYRSTDEGDSWTSLNKNLTVTSIKDIYISTSDIIFTVVRDFGGKIFRSTDNGNNWYQINNGLEFHRFTCVAVDSNGYIFAGTDSSIYRSNDNGKVWTEINNGLPPNLSFTKLSINSANKIFAATSKGIFKYLDSANSWRQINQNITNAYDITFNQLDNIFVGNWSSGGIYRSTDEGNTWTENNNGLMSPFVSAIKTNSQGFIFAGTPGNGVYISTDNGNSWTQKNQGFNLRPMIENLAVNINDDLYTSIGLGVYISTDHGNYWFDNHMGLPNNTPVFSFANNSKGQVFAATIDSGIYCLTEDKTRWIKTNPKKLLSIAINSFDIIFAGTLNGVFHSSDNGNTWTPTQLTESVYSLSIDANNTIYAGGYNYIYYSTNNGNTWIQKSISNAKTLNHIVKNSNGHIFALTQNGLFRSLDNGYNWEQLSNIPNYSINTILMNSNDNIFIGTNGGGVYCSKDNGDDWIQINQGLTLASYINSLAIDSKGYIFAGASNWEGGFAYSWLGVYRSIQPTTAVESNSVYIANGFELFNNYPNPFNSSTKIKFYLPSSALVNLKIYDITGREIKTILYNRLLHRGEYGLTWDANGYSSGVYFCYLTIVDSKILNKIKTKIKKIILLK